MKYTGLVDKDFFSKVFGVFSTRVFLFIFGMAASVVSARLLGPEGKGAFGVAIAISGLVVQFGNMGIHSANTYYLSKNPDELPQAVGNSMLVSAAVAGLCALAGVFFWLFPALAPILGWPLVIALAITPFSLYHMYQQNFLIALGRIADFNRLELINGVGYPVLLIVLGLLGWVTPSTALLASFLNSAAVVGAGFLRLRARIAGKIRVSAAYMHKTFCFGFKSYLSCLFSFLVLRIDLFLINGMLGASQAGLYSVTTSLADMLYTIASSVGMLLFPKLAAIQDGRARRQLAEKIFLLVGGLVAAAMPFAFVLCKPVIVFLYGQDYVVSAAMFQILLPGILFESLYALIQNYCSAIKRLNISIVAPAVGCAVNAVLTYIFLPRFGVEGAAIASTISYAIILGIMLLDFLVFQRKLAG